jgi:hypothetical protein
MDLAMAVGTKNLALIEFHPNFFPTSSVTLRGNPEVFFAGIEVMYFQCLSTSIISAARTFAAQKIQSHLADSLAPFLNGLNQVLAAIGVAPPISH